MKTVKATMYSFAAQWLHQNRIKIFSGKKEIMPFYATSYNFKTNPPYFSCYDKDDEELELLEPDVKIEKYYSDINRIGFKVCSIPVPGFLKKGMYGLKKMYVLVKNSRPGKAMETIPHNHKVEHDRANQRIRVTGKNSGPNGFGPWQDINPEKKIREYRQKVNLIDDWRAEEHNYLKSFFPYDKQIEKKIKIKKYLPIMISRRNTLICIPMEPPLTHDEPVIGFIGKRGGGKTFGAHALCDQAFHFGGRRIFVANDGLRETGTWCMPWDEDKADISILQNLGKINVEPRPLPCLYFHPCHKDKSLIVHEEKDNIQGSGFGLSFPFKDLMRNYIFYTKDNKEWDLGEKTYKYFEEMAEELINCKNEEDILELIDLAIPDEKKLDALKYKITATFKSIFKSNILDVSNKTSNEWRVKGEGLKGKIYNPVTASIVSGLVPILVTAEIKSQNYFPQYFRYFVNDIYEQQKNNEWFIRNGIKVWIYVDELTGLDSTKRPTVASEILGEITSQGRMNRTGFVWVTQNPEMITPKISVNTDYLFCSRVNNRKQAVEVSRNFDLIKSRIDDMLQLKPREVMACTTKKFVEIDEFGNHKIIEDEAILGTIIPPLSMHKAPTTVSI